MKEEIALKGIVLVQAPVIKHDIANLSADVKKRLKDLNIEKMVPTEDSLAVMKKLMADLNRELKEYEAQRIAIKKACLVAYDELEAVYKPDLSEPMLEGISLLKDKIDEVETALKDAIKKEVKSYFDEAILAESITFVRFEQVGINITRAASMKSFRTQIDTFVAGIKSDLLLIATQEHQAEIRVEYERTLKCSEAIVGVNARKELEKQAAARIKMIEDSRRVELLRKFPMIYHDLTKTYNYVSDESIMIKRSDLEDLTTSAFNILLMEVTAKIAAIKEPIRAPEVVLPSSKTIASEPVVATSPVKEQPAPVELKEEYFVTSFEVSGTYAQITALSEYLKSNKLNYKNL